MSHWAEIDADSKVIRVLVGDNNDPAGDEGYQWLIDNLGGTWIKTSYNSTIRYNYAGIGYTYDPIDDAFIAPVPCDHPELTLNDLKRWECATCEAALEQVSYPTA
jgi:hypothetical protein